MLSVKISKEGQRTLRRMLVEAVYAVLRAKADTLFHHKYRELRKRGLPGRKAAAAVARKLAQTIYALMDAYYARK